MKAIILCAGRGERMRPLTDAVPKPLLHAGGKPLAVWTIERLARAGIRDLVVNHAHLGAMIETGLGDGARYNVRIAYSAESEALETAGGIANALPLLGDGPFIAANGDIFCEYPYERLAAVAEAWRRSPASAPLAHVVLVPNPDHHRGGDFALDGSSVRNAGEAMLTFAGIGVYRPELFASIVRGERAKLAPLLREAAARDLLTGERFDGRWVDVGTPARLEALDAALRSTDRA